MNETLALLKLLAQSAKSKADGKGKHLRKAFADIGKRIEKIKRNNYLDN